MDIKSMPNYGAFPEKASRLDIELVSLTGQVMEHFHATVNRKSIEAYELGLDLCVGELTYRNGSWMMDVTMVEPDKQPSAYGGRWTRYLTSRRTPETEAALAEWHRNRPKGF